MKILVGMSGGLDSTYAALKLIKEGHEVVGAVDVMHEYTELEGARDAAKALGIPLVELDARDRFSAVKANFVREYSHGRTPNPCVVCNPLVKFRVLADYARANGFDPLDVRIRGTKFIRSGIVFICIKVTEDAVHVYGILTAIVPAKGTVMHSDVRNTGIGKGLHIARFRDG